MPNITFNTDDYYDDDTLKEMIEYETRCYIRGRIGNMIKEHEYWVPNFITLTAKKIVEDMLTEKIPGYKQQIIDKVQDTIEGMENYSIRYDDSFKKIFGECIEECRPMIKKRVEETCSEKLDASNLIDCVTDEFYNMLHKMLTEN